MSIYRVEVIARIVVNADTQARAEAQLDGSAKLFDAIMADDEDIKGKVESVTVHATVIGL